MTGMPVLHLRVRMETPEGRSFEGWSACGLVSMWFDKNYSKSEARREADLLYSVGEAVNGYLAAGSGTAWQIHTEVQAGVRRRLETAGLNGLTAGYGIALVDSAVIDGVCRMAHTSFYDALKSGLLGFDERLASQLPENPTATMAIRHTVGLGDPLMAADVVEPINDGLPETLEQVIDEYGTSYFKIKVNNNFDESLERLHRVAGLLDKKVGEYQATLDGNEAFADMDSFYEFVRLCAEDGRLGNFWKRVLWIEQPVARQTALAVEVKPALDRVRKLKSVIIDESDDSDDTLERAIEAGYAGISAKNCKGVFRTLHSYTAIQSAAPEAKMVLSSEDLTNQPIIPNHQDLCVAAALGIRHSERNGHHFFKGFQFIPEGEQRQALRDYPSLYRTGSDGIPSLRIESGSVSLVEVNRAQGLGVCSAPEWDSMEVLSLPTEAPVVS